MKGEVKTGLDMLAAKCSSEQKKPLKDQLRPVGSDIKLSKQLPKFLSEQKPTRANNLDSGHQKAKCVKKVRFEDDVDITVK